MSSLTGGKASGGDPGAPFLWDFLVDKFGLTPPSGRRETDETRLDSVRHLSYIDNAAKLVLKRGRSMGFKEVKAKVTKCLECGNYDHQVRGNIDVKNLLATGQISEEEAIRLIKKTKGTQYETSPLHGSTSIMVHLLKPVDNGRTWYIKFYFIEPNTMFISVH